MDGSRVIATFSAAANSCLSAATTSTQPGDTLAQVHAPCRCVRRGSGPMPWNSCKSHHKQEYYNNDVYPLKAADEA
jgi:hypothetical protein